MNKININICGTSYTISSDDAEEYMCAISGQVDKKMKNILDKSPKISTLMSAELVALEYCDLLNKATVKLENLYKSLQESAKKISDLQETIELKNLEIDELNEKLSKNSQKTDMFFSPQVITRPKENEEVKISF